jgi:hypothetical protein
MANEINVVLSMTASKGGASVNSVGTTGPASDTFDMTGTDMKSGTQIVTTTTAALSLGSVVAPYYVFLHNTSADPAEIIRVGNVNADPITAIVTELGAGDRAFLVIPNGITLYVESDSGSPSLFHVIVER